MKKIFVLIMVVMVSLATFAQNTYVTAPKSVNGWGTAADTLTASAVKYYTLSVKSPSLLKYSVAIFTDAVSGTPAFTALLQVSMDNVNWVDLDTITLSGGGDKYGDFAPSSNEATKRYYRIKITATSATQKSLIYCYWTFIKS